jgi:hypothetical protein
VRFLGRDEKTVGSMYSGGVGTTRRSSCDERPVAPASAQSEWQRWKTEAIPNCKKKAALEGGQSNHPMDGFEAIKHLTAPAVEHLTSRGLIRDDH